MSESAAGGLPVIRDVYPYLCVRDPAAAIEFYTGVFGAEELLRLTSLDGRIAHAELKLHVNDVDALTARARDAGAVVLREPADHGHGERQSRLRDPFGHEWLLGHELEA